ncbi:hypothetical protein G4V62_15190 [Bacillaceae bacterium SIJ1]|uniref:hypothetical protein n=1 Tax=Litoribacterium kuwaitense TaxID=1398745 RepID=UPI0013EAC7DE|nr:hypothetical protein [Litoribacterium kuwaitense]NGP46231.1 hypothetical protein [Litoribacterium kuwaitense]
MGIVVTCIVIAVLNIVAAFTIFSVGSLFEVLLMVAAPTFFMCTVVVLLYEILLAIEAANAPPIFKKKDDQ